MLNPVFHVGMLRSKMAIFNENSEILVKTLRESVNETSVDVLKYVKPCAMNIIMQFILGLKIDDIQNNKKISSFLQAVDKMSTLLACRLFNPLPHWKFMLYFCPSGRQYIRMCDDTKGFVKKITQDMRNAVISGKLAGDDKEKALDSETQTHKSFAHILLDLHMKDPSFTMYDLESDVATFITGGFDTVSQTVMWTLYLLGHDPVVQERVYDELEFIGDGSIEYEDIQKLKYLECVIKESLRLFPPLPMHARRTNKDIQCGKYNVPKGSDIAFFPYMLHRNPDIYSNPEKFDPERFAEGNFEKRPKMYAPFSEGIRNCIGKGFAMLELKVILAHVLRSFRITSLDKRKDLVLCYEITLNPSKPLRIQLASRE